MQIPDPSALDSFALRQRVTLMVNRYEVRAGGSDGPLIALAQQKRMALRESVTFFADEGRTQPLFSFRARQVIDLNAGYDVFDAHGQPIVWFRKDFGQSLLRSTFHVGVPWQGLEATGQERNQLVAILRRFAEEFAWPVHFDFRAADGTEVMSSVRRWSLRDHYDVTLPAAPNGARMDWRVAACMAVAVDALLNR